MGYKTAAEHALRELLQTIGEKSTDGGFKQKIEEALHSGDVGKMRKVLHEFDRLDTAVIHRLRGESSGG